MCFKKDNKKIIAEEISGKIINLPENNQLTTQKVDYDDFSYIECRNIKPPTTNSNRAHECCGKGATFEINKDIPKHFFIKMALN